MKGRCSWAPSARSDPPPVGGTPHWGRCNRSFVALTFTATLVPVMYEAPPGTATDQVAGSSPADVAVNSVMPTVTVTLTLPCEPVSPEIANPAAFSAMFTVLSTAIASTFSTSAPTAATATV